MCDALHRRRVVPVQVQVAALCGSLPLGAFLQLYSLREGLKCVKY